MPGEWFEKLLLAWIPLFVAIDPVGMVPLFLGMTHETTAEYRRHMGDTAILTATVVGVAFMFLGRFIFRALGISDADFQIAGGLVLFLLASGELVGRRRQAFKQEDTGIVPLGLPIIAGPAMLTTLLLLVDTVGWVYTLVALLLNMALLFVALRQSEWIVKVVGPRALRAASKLVALLLAAIAVHMVRIGLQSI